MRCLLVIVSLVVFLTLSSVATDGENEKGKNYSNQALVSIAVNNECDLKYLQKIVKENAQRPSYRSPRESEDSIELWNAAMNENVLMQIPTNMLNVIESQLINKNMKYRVAAPDLQTLLSRESEEFKDSREKRMIDYIVPADFFNTYHSLRVVTKFLKSFTRNNADMAQLQVIGHSFEKRQLLAVKISASSRRRITGNRNSKKMILIDCGCHAREWVTISFCLYFMNRIINDYKQGKANMKNILAKYDFTIIPMLNPDGYQYSQQVDRLWRKNRSKAKDSSCYGVDLNRNFDVAFVNCSASGACSEDYCGHTPFSEPESRSLYRLLMKNKGRIKAYFTMHAYSQLWLVPWAKASNIFPQNYDNLVRVAEIGVEAIRKRYGTEFVVGMPSKLLYSSGGTSMDYALEKGFAEYSYSLELRDKGQFGFLLPKDQIQPLNEETTDGLLAAISAM